MGNTKFYKSVYSPTAGQVFIVNTTIDNDQEVVSQNIIIYKKGVQVNFLDQQDWPNVRLSTATAKLVPEFFKSRLEESQFVACDRYLSASLEPRDIPTYYNFIEADNTFLFELDKDPYQPSNLMLVKTRSIDPDLKDYIDIVIKAITEAASLRATRF